MIISSLLPTDFIIRKFKKTIWSFFSKFLVFFQIFQMGLGPSKVTDNLYVGSLRDGTDAKKLEKHQITHIVTILSSLQYKTEENKEVDQFTVPGG